LLVLTVAAVVSVIAWLTIGGQPTAVSRLLMPLTGIIATRLVAEELLLRVWLLPVLGRRIGDAAAIVLLALVSAGIAIVLRPAGISPIVAAAPALAASLAGGLLSLRMRRPAVTILFRLLVP
jgi:membrane protease YdiL (CAAX protease family)